MTLDWLGSGPPSTGEPSGGGPSTTNWLDRLPPEFESELRDYQRDEIAETADALRAGVRRILIQLITGGGKTHIMAGICGAAVAAHLRVVIMCTRTRLVKQIHERLAHFKIGHGVIAASFKGHSNFGALVQVVSVDTLSRRTKSGKMPMPGAEVVIFDEAHLATAETRLALLDYYPDAVRIGLTATPARKSGLGLGVAFDRLICGPTARELQHMERLCPLRIFSTPIVTSAELKALPRDAANDYATGELGKLLSQPKLVGDVRENWLRLAGERRTIIFCCNKAHGQALVDDFMRQGISAELLVDTDEESDREEAIARLENGTTRILVNCFLMSYGVDLPTVDCIVLARPTRSLVMYLQMVGRGLRTAPGKQNCVLIDHGRVVESLGLPTSDYPWTLDEGRNVNQSAAREFSAKGKQETMRTCPECAAMWLTSEDGHACPNCDWKPPQKTKRVEVEQADLQEIAESAEQVRAVDANVVTFFRQAMAWHVRKYPQKWIDNEKTARGFAWHKTKEKFGLTEQWAPRFYWQEPPAAMVPLDVDGWLQSKNIAYWRAQQAQGRYARR